MFELCNSPATFSQMANNIFVDELNSLVFVYLDDVLIYSRSVEEHWATFMKHWSPSDLQSSIVAPQVGFSEKLRTLLRI